MISDIANDQVLIITLVNNNDTIDAQYGSDAECLGFGRHIWYDIYISMISIHYTTLHHTTLHYTTLHYTTIHSKLHHNTQ